MVEAGQQGVWISALIHPVGWDHPMNYINWYAIQQYMKDPYADPAKIKLDWATKEFGSDSAATVVKVVDKVTEAARGMYEFDALWTANHSRFPNP